MAPKKKSAPKKEEPKAAAAPKKEEPKAAAPKKEEPKAAPKKEEPKAKAAVPAAKADVPKAPPKAPPAKKEEPAAKAAAPEKRKAEEKSEGPAKKEAKVAEVDGVEKEKDSPVDKRPALKEAVGFLPSDTTLNVIPTLGGQVLMALSDGGMQYLIAGARGDVGVKAGRYMFEVKIIEALNPAESSAAAGRGRAPAPRQLVRIGFSTAGSPLILGDSEDHICFDSEGAFHANKRKNPAAQRFTRDQIIAVVLNLDPKSPNHNTLSLFREGERISEPQQIPERLHGKTFFPHVSFRNVSVQVLFGQQPAKALPFKCRQLGAAAQADVEKAEKPVLKDGKYEVMFPVAFPDEGTFEWLDMFLANNPHYVELSDRKIVEWAGSSGLWKPKATNWSKTSNDKPEFSYGLPAMDDFSTQRIIKTVAAAVPRNYVIMEVKSNLLQEDRKKVLERFSAPHFKKVAHVVMGEPDDEFKQMALDKLLKDKQAKSDMAWRTKKAEEKRKKDMEEKQKKLAEMRKKADEARKKAAEDAKKKAEEAKKKAEEAKKKEEEAKRKAEAKKKAEEAGEEYVEEEEPKEEEEVKEEKMEVDEEGKDETKEAEEEAKEEEKKEDVKMEEEEETEPPKVELTEEEQKMWFKPSASGPGTCSDLTAAALAQSFGGFSIPESSEGFDEIRFAWQGEKESKDYLKKWVLEKKRSSRMDDLQPGQWFQDKVKEWQKLFAEWQAKLKAFKSSAAQKEKEAAAKKKAEEKAKKEKEGKEGEEEEEEEEEAPPVDVMMVDDVCDVGTGEPLFKDFAFEDWALLQLRYELYLLQVAFKKDVNDPDRPGVHENHFSFYYTKYFRKTLTPKHFNVSSLAEIPDLVKDTASWDPDEKVLATTLEDDLESVTIFVKFAEESRRERQRRIDAGDETARLKFSPLAIQQPVPKPLSTPLSSPMGAAAGGPKAWQGNPAPKAWPQSPFRPAGVAWGAAGGQWGAKGRW